MPKRIIDSLPSGKYTLKIINIFEITREKWQTEWSGYQIAEKMTNKMQIYNLIKMDIIFCKTLKKQVDVRTSNFEIKFVKRNTEDT